MIHPKDFIWMQRLFLVLVSLTLSQQAFSKPWTVDQDIVIDTELLNQLHIQYPDIKSSKDLQGLLKDIALIVPLNSLFAVESQAGWIIKGHRGQRIYRMQAQLIAKRYLNDIQRIFSRYKGLVHSPASQEQFKQDIHQYFYNRGFFNNQVILDIKTTRYGVQYGFRVLFGEPCTVGQIIYEPQPPVLMPDLEEGMLCDFDLINTQIEQYKKLLFEENYLEAEVAQPQSFYNPKSNLMTLRLKIKTGQKIVYEVIENDKPFDLDDIIDSDRLSSLESILNDVNTLKVELLETYHNNGYADAEIKDINTIIDQKKNQKTIQIIVHTGPQYRLGTIRFIGARHFSENEIFELTGLNSFYFSTPLFRLSEINEKIEFLKSKYQSEGFWEVKILSPNITKDPDTGIVKMIIQIHEGPQWILADIRIRGSQNLPSSKIYTWLQMSKRSPIDQAKLISLRKTLTNHYVRQGYLYSQVHFALDYRRGNAFVLTTLTIEVKEGSKVQIGAIKVTGLVKTQPRVIYRELRFKPGDVYDPELIEASRRALLALGIFKSIRIEAADRDFLDKQPAKLDLVIHVQETQPGKVVFGPGWSLYKGLRYSAEFAYNNIGGEGRQFYARGQISEEAQQKPIGDKTLIGRTITLGYLEPYLLQVPVDGNITLNSSAYADTKWVITQGGELTLTHKLRYVLPDSKINMFYGQKINKEESRTEQKIGYLNLIGGNLRIGRIGARYRLDQRDNITWPTSGYVLSLEASASRFYLGSDLFANYWSLAYSYYYGFFSRWVLAFGVSFDAFRDIKRRGDKANMLPQTETLYLGGSNTIRGYRERSLGPIISYDRLTSSGVYERVTSEELGGSQRALYKAELRCKLFSDQFAITLFTDLGSTFFTHDEITDFNLKERKRVEGSERNPSEIIDNHPYFLYDLISNPKILWEKNYASYGLALNYLTPLGSVNLSYGLPWKRCPSVHGDCIPRGTTTGPRILQGNLHINIGTDF